MPNECLNCWLKRRNERNNYIGVTLQDTDVSGATFRMEHGIGRARDVGRRVITELMTYGWDDHFESTRMIVRTYQSEIDCLLEAPENEAQ